MFPADTVILDGNAGTVQHLKHRVAGFRSGASGAGIVQFFHSGALAEAGGFTPYLDLLDRNE
jgi:hypothetical protein